MATESSQHWHILGPGAIGCLWAAYWQLDQHPCTLIGRKAKGTVQLSLHQPQQSHQWPQAWQDHTLTSSIHRLLVTTKAHQTAAAIDSIRHKLHPQATVIVLQNGMAATELKLAPEQQLLAATTTDGAYLNTTSEVVHAGRGITWLGPLIPNTSDITPILKTLPTGLDIRPCNNISERLWQKLAINCAINGLTVLHHCRNGELLQKPSAMSTLQALCVEIQHIAARLAPDVELQGLPAQVEEVLIKTANNINSMRQDIESGRRSEINQLNGYLLRRAEALGLDLPHNRAITEAILDIEAGLPPVV